MAGALGGFLRSRALQACDFFVNGDGAGPILPLLEVARRLESAAVKPKEIAPASIEVLVEHPAGLSIENLATEAGYAVGGGGFRNALSALRTAGVLVGGNGGAMRLSDELVAAGGGA